jgi:hypothetical protein
MFIQVELSSHSPVTVSRMVILKDSPSIICAPELGPVGDKRLVMAWIPCKVPAKTRYSLDVSCSRPSADNQDFERRIVSRAKVRTSEIPLIDQATCFVDNLPNRSVRIRVWTECGQCRPKARK